jgi:putative membrane-bound dehydrogenase-like protein
VLPHGHLSSPGRRREGDCATREDFCFLWLRPPRVYKLAAFMNSLAPIIFCCCAFIATAAPKLAVPTVNDSQLKLQLLAAEPDIVTPTGIAVDARERIFVIESHTHFPKKDYPGPKSDRVKIFTDSAKDGRFDKVSVFAEGFRYAMNLRFSPAGELYLVHRNGVVILRDRDSDGVCEEQKSIVELDTRGNYPHNGLGGIAFSPDGWLYIGMGENLGENYTIKGSDGSSYSGGGEGGNVFRCKPDGSRLEHIATGFWNAFGLESDRAGHLFCVDNDPDSRPPCRLIDVVPGGDYGYRFRYGRSGLHPFQAWNGELPGTLPMVAGTGEAPSGVLDCDRAALPSRYYGGVFVTSWGDHRLEFYPLVTNGASLRAEREVVVQGDESFRPVTISAAPDGSIYFTDWVDADYSVHGKGRIWKLSSNAPRTKPPPIQASPARRKMFDLLESESAEDYTKLARALSSDDPFMRSAAVIALSRAVFRTRVIEALQNREAAVRLGALLALRRGHETNVTRIVEEALKDPNEEVRLAAVVWAGEDNLQEVLPTLPKVLSSGRVSPVLFRAYSAAMDRLTKRQGTNGAVAAISQVMIFPVTNNAPKLSPFSIFPERKKTPNETRPGNDAEWRKALQKAGDPAAGRRLFFDPGVGCAQCHRIEDYGGETGPDLSVIGRIANRDRIIDSILNPSKEIPPQFVQHTIEVKSGESYSGILTSEQSDGTVALLMSDGRGVVIPGSQISARSISKVSLMPEGLAQGLTVEEFRDLLAYLLSLK